LSNLDYGVLGLYFVVVLLIGLRAASRAQSGEDLFLEGRFGRRSRL
jgi:Na+/proline symporter